MSRDEILEWLNRELNKGPSDQERWEAFYLTSLPPLVVSDRDEYNRIRRRLLAEGKRCCYEIVR